MNNVFELKRTATTGKEHGSMVVRIKGNIDEHFGNIQIPSLGPSQIDVICDGIVSINSAGAKAWIRYFRKLRTTGHSIRFYDLSPVLTQFIALNIPLAERNEVVSMRVPLYCRHCNLQLNTLHYLCNGIKGLVRLNEQTDCQCGQKLMIDDLFLDYAHVQRKNNQSSVVSQSPGFLTLNASKAA
jgi:hypothetical protein